jgi:hypothetical protein
VLLSPFPVAVKSAMETTPSVTSEQLKGESRSIHPDREKNAHGISGFFPAIVNLLAEDGHNFFQYLKDLGLSRENNLVVLSSRHHYFYDEKEMKNVKTLINLRKLNLIKYLDEFLFSLVQILPTDTRFIGCFSDCRVSINFRPSIIHPVKSLRHKVNFMELLGARNLSRNRVTEVLESFGFSIINMTEKDGITYFCAQKTRNQAVLRA